MPKKITPLATPIFSEPRFNEDSVTLDPTGFSTSHASDTALYKQIQKLLSSKVVSFRKSRHVPASVFPLQKALGASGAELVQAIAAAGRIVFHSVGDTGASNAGKYGNELHIADQLTADCHAAQAADRPAFLFHLGDLVYNFGESRYYYDQFYEPLRNYPAPVFAIAGNHDSFVVPGTPKRAEPLATFMRNFCALHPVVTPEAGSLHRSAMTQPGVYFTLDAPFVRIIGLFTNALEDPGVISSQDGRWKGVPDLQLAFLEAQLTHIRDGKYPGAVILALHHPPFSYSPPPRSSGSGGNHGGSPAMLRQIDAICARVGVYPHAVLSGHAHNYQRYTRTVVLGGRNLAVPFIVCGCGGHNASALVQSSKGRPAQQPVIGADASYLDTKPALTTGGLVFENYDDKNYGYLRGAVDANTLQIAFVHLAIGGGTASVFDSVSIDLKTRAKRDG